MKTEQYESGSNISAVTATTVLSQFQFPEEKFLKCDLCEFIFEKNKIGNEDD